ncbi:MAG: glycosyltransferase family 1 protein, partial [Opitutae bacterium]|nr:glycosyltransferase family 1 protein [Opitutae bacterium]
FLFDFDSTEDFACKIKDAISDRKRLAEIGREARRWLQSNVSLEQQALRYSELYKELVG